MKKQLSAIDLHFLLKELEVLKDSRIDKIYHPEKFAIVLSLFKSNAGKKILKINVGQSLYTDEKEDYEEILGFGMALRKHIGGYFLRGILQIEPERIVKFSFKAKDAEKYLYIEFFGKGNAILCDEQNTIINSLEHHEFKDRTIKPKLKYQYPVMKYNIFDVNKNQLEELFKNSKKDTIITCLAVELGLGGVYSEEVCLLSNITKNTDPKNIEEDKIKSILNAIEKIISNKIEAEVIFENNNPVDAVPFDLEFYQKRNKQKFQSFSEALRYFYSQFREIRETESDKRLRNLQRIIEEQKQTIERLKEEEKELREKGELIYHNYNLIKEILEELNKASKKYSWKDIKEKLKGHRTIKELNEKERKIVVEIG